MQQTAKLPEFSGRFFTQRLYGLSDPFSGFSVSAAIPIFGKDAYKSKLQAAETEKQLQEQKLQYTTKMLTAEYQQKQTNVLKNGNALQFYETVGLEQANEIIKAANQSYRAGEISYAYFSLYLTQAIDIQKNYLDKLNEYNHSVIQLYYFTNR